MSETQTVSNIFAFMFSLFRLSVPEVHASREIRRYRSILTDMLSRVPPSVQSLFHISLRVSMKCTCCDGLIHDDHITTHKRNTLGMALRNGSLRSLIMNEIAAMSSQADLIHEHDAEVLTSRFLIIENSAEDSCGFDVDLGEKVEVGPNVLLPDVYKIKGLVMQNEEVVKVVEVDGLKGMEHEFVECHRSWHYLYVVMQKD